MSGKITKWLLRLFLVGVLLLLVAAVALYLMATSVVEALLEPLVEERSAELKLSSIQADLSGVEVNIESYVEADFSFSGAILAFGWSELLELPDRLSGRADFGSLVVHLPEKSSDGPSSLPDFSAQMESFASRLDSLPVGQLEVNIWELTLERGSRRVEMSLESNLLTGSSGERHLSLELKGGQFFAQTRAKLSGQGRGLDLDFIASFSDWERFSQNFLSDVLEGLSRNQMDLFIEPVAEGAGFVELSGYLRWNQEAAQQSGLTLLADLGPLEVYTPAGEAYFDKTSIGFTMDASQRLRAFGKGGIESIRVESWSQSEGDWEVKLNDRHIATELRLGESIELSLSHDDFWQALSGAGSGQFFVEAKEAGFELLHALEVPNLPPDLGGRFGAVLEGKYALKDFTLESAEVELDVVIAEATLPTSGVALESAKAKGSLQLIDGAFFIEELSLLLGDMDLSGIALSDLAVKASGQPEGVIVLDAMSARLLGGELRLGALQIEQSADVALPIRIELDSIDMQQLSKSVPQFKGEVEGRLSGHLLCEWDNGSLALKDGLLLIDEDAEAWLRYNVDGLLTRGMNVDSVAYKQYRMAEVAFQNMLLKRFRVDVFPEGDSTRPLRVELFGESEQDGVTVPVDYTLNVNADDAEGLMYLLRMIQRGELELN